MKKFTLQLKSLTFLFLLTSLVSFAQQVEKCATDPLMAEERQKNPAMFDQNRAQLEEFTRNYALNNAGSKSTTTVTKIPTVIHVVHNGEAVGTYPNMSDVQLQSAITNLNAAYQNTGIYAGSPYYNSPMNVEFVLAKVKEDGTATTGIERHDVSSKPYAADYDNGGIRGGTTTGVDSGVLFKDYFWNPQDYMNIWIVKKIDGIDIGTVGTGTLGYATLPTTFPGSKDGLVCQARAFGYMPSYDPNNPGATPGFDFGTTGANASGNGTADHEVGHYLNLLHTFTGDQNGTACPNDTTVGTDSDGCADIAPHKRTNSICPGITATGNDCTGGTNEHQANFMDYSNDPCFTGFSNDQRTRVHAAIDGPRSAFKTSIADNAPSGNYPAAVTNTPVIQLVDNGALLGIFEVVLNGNTFKSLGCRNDGGYINRVASQPATTLVENTLTNMSVKVGVGNNSNNELVDVYIDYNNDGAFTTSERVYQTPAGSGKKNGDVFSFSFTTPAAGGFVNNQKLRMRVISDFDNGGDTITNAYTTQVGNIEDYSVIFNPTLSVEANTIEVGAISIYPNPANSILNIKNTSGQNITATTIFDALGRRVYTNSGTTTISVDNLKDGVYFLKLDFENNNSITKRFIKK